MRVEVGLQVLLEEGESLGGSGARTDVPRGGRGRGGPFRGRG